MRDDFPDYCKLKADLGRWWSIASPNARNELMNEVLRYPNHHRQIEVDFHKGYDWSFAVDFSNNSYLLGDKFVYVYVTDRYIPYYVGLGNTERLRNKISRNEDFREKFQRVNSKVFILASWVREKTAQDIETLLIWLFQMRGYPLTNRDKMLKSCELRELNSLDSNSDMSDLQRKYYWMMNDYSEVVEMYERFNHFCLNTMLSDDCVINSKGCINTPREEPSSKTFWVIDGEIRSVVEWCNYYGRTPSATWGRIHSWDCTPKEALTFPTVPRSYRSIPLEWLRSQGCIPGTDLTSWVATADEVLAYYKSYSE